MPSFTALEPHYMPKGFKFSAQVNGIHACQFWGSKEQVALLYRPKRTAWGLGSEITVAWAPERDLELSGTTGHAGIPVVAEGRPAVYHDGMWTGGPGPSQRNFEPDGIVHWGRDLVHSLTIHTDHGVFGVRAPHATVPQLGHLIQIMSSMASLAAT
jgi:hypothetical protein